MADYKCPHCGSVSMKIMVKGTQHGLYCATCGKWLKWVGKSERLSLEENIHKNDIVPSKEWKQAVDKAVEEHVFTGYTGDNDGFYNKEIAAHYARTKEAELLDKKIHREQTDPMELQKIAVPFMDYLGVYYPGCTVIIENNTIKIMSTKVVASMRRNIYDK